MADGGRPCPPWLLAPPGEEQASQDKLGLCPPPAPPSPPTPSSPGPVPVQTSFVRPLGCPAPLRPAPCPSLTTHSPTGPTSSCHPSCTQAPAAPLTCPGSTTNPHSPLYPQRVRACTHIYTRTRTYAHTHTCTHTHFCQPCFCQQLLKLLNRRGLGRVGCRDWVTRGCRGGLSPNPSPASSPWALPPSPTCFPPTSGWQPTPC